MSSPPPTSDIYSDSVGYGNFKQKPTSRRSSSASTLTTSSSRTRLAMEIEKLSADEILRNPHAREWFTKVSQKNEQIAEMSTMQVADMRRYDAQQALLREEVVSLQVQLAESKRGELSTYVE